MLSGNPNLVAADSRAHVSCNAQSVALSAMFVLSAAIQQKAEGTCKHCGSHPFVPERLSLLFFG